MFPENAVSTQIVRQYVTLLQDWEKLPDRYRTILEQVEEEPKWHNMPDFQDGTPMDQLKDLLVDETLPEKDRKFIDIARQYYLEAIKKRCDDKFQDILQKICVDPKLANDEKYGRGKYAHALFLKDLIGLPEMNLKSTVITPDLLNQIIKDYVENHAKRVQNARDYLTGRLSDTEKRATVEQRAVKWFFDQKKKRAPKFSVTKLPFNSIDYRAPRDGLQNASLYIASGYLGKGSRELCTRLTEDGFVSALERLQKSGWEVNLFYMIKNGSGEGERFRILCNFKGLLAMSSEERKACFDPENGRYAKLLRGEKKRNARENPDFQAALQLLNDHGVFAEDGLDQFHKDLDEYFGISQNKQVILSWFLQLIREIPDDEMTPARIRQRSVEGVAVFGPDYEALFDRYVFLPADRFIGKDA